MAGSFTPKQQNWKWFQDDAAEPSTSYAAENTQAKVPYQTTTKLRLRVTIAETGGKSGSGTVTVQYSTDNVNFTAFGSGNHWNYANGAATNAGTTTTFKTTDATTHGLYHEDGSTSESWGASAIRELDVCIAPTANVTQNQTYYFQVLIGGTAVPLNSGETHANVITNLQTTKTQAGNARVQKSVSQTQLGKGNIRATTSKTQAGKGRIQVTRSAPDWSNLIHYWPMEEDLANRQDLVGGVPWTNGSIGNTTGIHGNCAIRNASTLGNFSISSLTIPSIVSYSFWIYLNSAPSGYTFFFIPEGSNDIGIALLSDRTIDLFTGANGSGLTTSNQLELNQWHHIVITVKSIGGGDADISLYLDAQLNSVGIVPLGGDPGSTGSATMFGSGIDAKLDEFAMFSRELTSTDVRKLYRDGVGTFYPSQAISGKARITVTTPRTQLGKARMRATSSQAQLGKARVQKTVTQTQPGKARVQKSVTQTQLGKARVRVTTTRTQPGKADVRKSASQTTQGKARIQRTSSTDGAGGSPTSVDLSASDDALVSQDNPTTNYGSAEFLSVGTVNSDTNAPDGLTNTWLKFDLSSIPPGSTITSAVLSVGTYFADTNPTGGAPYDTTISAYSASNTSWSEGAITWNNAPTGSVAGTESDSVSISNPPTAFSGLLLEFDVSGDVPTYLGGSASWVIKSVGAGLRLQSKDYSGTVYGPQKPKLHIEYTAPSGHKGLARIQKTVTQTQPGKANIRATTTRTQPGKARVQKTATQTQQGKARLVKTSSQTQTGKSRVQTTVTQAQPGKARIQQTTSQTQLGKARVKVTSTQTQLGKGRLQKTVAQTQAGKARVQATTSQSQPGKGRVQKSATQTQSGKARVKVTTTQSQPGKARVQNTAAQTQSGKARIRATASQTQLGRARVQKTSTQTQPGRARIQNSSTATQPGKSRVQQAATRNQPGKARIRTSADQTQSGKARVQVTATKDQPGQSRIQRTSSQNIQGKAKISVTGQGTQQIQGKANIQATTTKEQFGQSRIQATTSQSITGAARIVAAAPVQTVGGGDQKWLDALLRKLRRRPSRKGRIETKPRVTVVQTVLSRPSVDGQGALSQRPTFILGGSGSVEFHGRGQLLRVKKTRVRGKSRMEFNGSGALKPRNFDTTGARAQLEFAGSAKMAFTRRISQQQHEEEMLAILLMSTS